MKAFVMLFAVLALAASAAAYTSVVMEEFEEDNTGFLWSDAAIEAGYVDTADMTPFSDMVLHPDNVFDTANEYDECKAGYTLVELPLGPACVANSELGGGCGASCEPPSVCWRGLCVDARRNLCMRVNQDTGDVTFHACN